MRSFTQRWIALLTLCTLGGALGNACSASPGTPQQTSSGQGGSGTASGTGGDDSTGSLVGSGGNGGDPQITSGNGGSTGPGSGGGCAKAASEATSKPQPADIIIAVDTSGSMDEEIGEVQANLNAFASLITSSGIDVHVILIADANICIPAPLGSGQCSGADSSLPTFQHVVHTVASTDALDVIVATYPEWKDSLRPGALKNFLVVSDDNSATSAASFTSQLLALDPPTFDGFFFHGIVSSNDGSGCFGFSCPAANPCCVVEGGFACVALSADEGTVYKELIQQTMGVYGDLCLQDFDPVFQQLATGVISSSKLSCEYPIPAPPDGQMVDPGLVNVTFTDPSGTIKIYNVPGGLADCGAQGGWYYDDPATPTKVVMCPSTCTALQSVAEGTVDVVFGCSTEVVPN